LFTFTHAATKSSMDTDGNQGQTQRRPMTLETSRAGVFAVGDVRSGSVKRVSSAAGEGRVLRDLMGGRHQ
jgi:thioredoxin reductase